MNRIACAIICCICLFSAPLAAGAVQVDISSGGVEVTGPNTMTLHNAFVKSSYYYGLFKWNPTRNIWSLIGSGLEDPTFSSREYYPLEQGMEWTYQLSGGGTLTLTVNGTDDICGVTCIRLEGSDGSVTDWLNDETGVSMARFLNGYGYSTTWCPPMKIAPPQMYVGSQSLNQFSDAAFKDYSGNTIGLHSGWSSFVVKGLEDVTVPAGTFTDCLRTTYVYSFTDTLSGMYGYRTEEAWYAQNVGIARRVSTDLGIMGGAIISSIIETFQLSSFTGPATGPTTTAAEEVQANRGLYP